MHNPWIVWRLFANHPWIIYAASADDQRIVHGIVRGVYVSIGKIRISCRKLEQSEKSCGFVESRGSGEATFIVIIMERIAKEICRVILHHSALVTFSVHVWENPTPPHFHGLQTWRTCPRFQKPITSVLCLRDQDAQTIRKNTIMFCNIWKYPSLKLSKCAFQNLEDLEFGSWIF